MGKATLELQSTQSGMEIKPGFGLLAEIAHVAE
jgi:hypothetical protein